MLSLKIVVTLFLINLIYAYMFRESFLFHCCDQNVIHIKVQIKADSKNLIERSKYKELGSALIAKRISLAIDCVCRTTIMLR